MEYTLEQVNRSIAEHESDPKKDSFWYEITNDWDGKPIVELSDLDHPAVFIDGETGREGGGENIWVVFQVGETFFRKTGYYNSWEGSDWSYGDLEIVVPKEKLITVYESI